MAGRVNWAASDWSTIGMSELEFTGERFHPQCEREMWYEHWHRYVFALPLVAGKRVLDLACGEGYGSALLARKASHVVGVDYEEQAVAHARKVYRAENLEYRQGDATRLDWDSEPFDVVVSFETIEHVENQAGMLDSIQRVLKPAGVLLISSPDRKHYSDETGYKNPYHVRELYREEFEHMLRQRFERVRVWGQRLLFASALWPLDRAVKRGGMTVMDAQKRMLETDVLKPMYEMALCSNGPLPDMDDLHLFTDREASVYNHYDDEVRRNMAARKVLADYEQQMADLRNRVRELEEALQQRRRAERPRQSGWRWWRR